MTEFNSPLESLFSYAFRRNVFDLELVTKLKQHFAGLADEVFERHPYGYCYTIFPCVDFAKWAYSKETLMDLSRLLGGRQVRRSKKYKVPQIYVSPPKYEGLPIHNDSGQGRDVTLIYFLEGWTDSRFGGELCLYKDPSKASEILRVPPEPNSMVFMELNKDSWHAVNPCCTKQKRVTIIVDYDLA